MVMPNPNTLRPRRPDLWFDYWPLGAAALLLAVALPSFVEWREFSRLLAHGATAPATITSTTIDASGRYSVDVIHYEFAPPNGGDRITGTERLRQGPSPDVTPGEWMRKGSKGELAVRFLPSDPRVHRLDLELDKRLGRARFWAILWLAAAAVFGTFGGVRIIQRHSER